jgi:predicted alpha/beta superfamily hydrolase
MAALLLLVGALAWQQAALPFRPFLDLKHESKVFGESRNYRILLPPDYATSSSHYPVIYFFHGHSDRYTLESYDGGTDFVPKMVDYVSKHNVIIVLVDGYVAGDYTGFYGGAPWDLMRGGGTHDFGAYMEELIAYIDGTYRTISDRRHRATSGLSMGGFMSFWISARYPHLIGSASAFNPGHEFYVGESGRRELWRIKDNVANHTNSMIRLIRASGDYISQYHEEARAAYANADKVNFEYRMDEYHRHWITSIAETFDFHSRAFANSSLDNVPLTWSHANPYRHFSVWGYEINVDGAGAAMVYLQDVRQGGLRVTARRWAPDGPPPENVRITIKTASIYTSGATYTLADHNLTTNRASRMEIPAAKDGTLTFSVDGAGHQMSFIGPGTGAQPPVLLPLTSGDRLRLSPQTDISLPIRIYNPRGVAMKAVSARLISEYPTVQLLSQSAEIPSIETCSFADLSNDFRVRFTAGAGYYEPTRLQLNLTYDGWYETSETIDVLVLPEIIPGPAAIEILDGRTLDFKVFRQSGNQGGGKSIDRRVTEGKGNGNGILEPGEEATIWVKMPQGMDPFDKGNWYRCKVYSNSPWLTEVADLQEPKQREWTSSMERTSVIRLSPQAPRGTKISITLDNESWSFRFTPDVRFGVEKLYQAFQFHTNHLHRYELKVP